MGTLAAGLAHELNNILTPARAFAEILALGETSPTQTVDYGRRILDATIASNAITKALLTYTKQSIYSPEPINLLNLLNLQIRPVLAQVIPDEVTLTVTCPRRLTLIVDAQLLQQSITNLVLNAVDALPQGGTITIAARQVPADGTRPPHAEIIVRDTGQGIPQEQVSQIFDPFFTTKKHGTGLGLPAVLGAMERHDGCREGGKGYPCRAVRTQDYLYIYNFEPGRWPSGSPDPRVCARSIPFGEIDTSPTKSFMMESRMEHGIAHLAELSFGMRPAEELYDLKKDPEQLANVAGLIEYSAIQHARRRQLFDHLKKTRDPRVVGGKVEWDHYPYYGRISTPGWKVTEKKN